MERADFRAMLLLTPSVPSAVAAPPPRPRLSGWTLGAASIALSLLSLILCLIGDNIAQRHMADCPLTDIWRGALFAVASVGVVLPGIACGLAGVVGALCRRAAALPALVGLGLNAGVCALFYVLWC